MTLGNSSVQMWRCCVVRLQQAKAGAFAFQESAEYAPIRLRHFDARVAKGVATHQTDINSRDYDVRSPEFISGDVRQVPSDATAGKPTHFLSLRIPPGSSLVAAFRDIHRLTRDFNEREMPLFVPLQKLHLTLSVGSIAPEHVPAVSQHIRKLLAEHNTKPLTLRLRGLGHFNERVVFAKVSAELDSAELHSMANHIRQGLGKIRKGPDGALVSSSSIVPPEEAVVNLRSNPRDGYVPHITVAKVRPHQRKAFDGKVPRSLWAPIQFDDFGDVVFSSMDLCEMAADPTTGYYKVVDSFAL